MDENYADLSGVMISQTEKKIYFDDGNIKIHIKKKLIQYLQGHLHQHADFEDIEDGEVIYFSAPYVYAYNNGLI